MIFMSKRGFTLIELLAVIAILGLLIAIISPVVTNLLNESKTSLSGTQVDVIITASREYMINHSELLPSDDDSYSISVETLINSGIIDNEKVIDPSTREVMTGCVVVTYNSQYNQHEYNYRNSCL